MSDDEREVVPTEQRGGRAPGEHEGRQKGEWAANAGDGIVPAELGGSDAPDELLADDPDLGSSVLGRTTGSEEPATEDGVDRHGGESADAVTDGGPETKPDSEPDLKDAASGPRQVDLESADS